MSKCRRLTLVLVFVAIMATGSLATAPSQAQTQAQTQPAAQAASSSITVGMTPRWNDPGPTVRNAGDAKNTFWAQASPAQPGRGIQVFRRKINYDGSVASDWKKYARGVQKGSGQLLFAVRGGGGGTLWEYTAHNLPYQGEPEVSAVYHTSERNNGWRLVQTDEFGATSWKQNWKHRPPLRKKKNLCSIAPKGHKRTHSDGTVVVQGSGYLTLKNRLGKQCGKWRLRVNGYIQARTSPMSAGPSYVVSARMKMPESIGNRSAIWLQSAQGVEYDIAESIGRRERQPCRGSDTVTVQPSKPATGNFSGLTANWYTQYKPDSGWKKCLTRRELERANVPGYGNGKSIFNTWRVYSLTYVPATATAWGFYSTLIDGKEVYRYGIAPGTPFSANSASLLLSNLLNDKARIEKGSGSRNLKVDWVRVWCGC